MKQIFKQLIFLWTILFTNFLWADGTDTQITITDASAVHEYDDHLSFTIQLSQAPWFGSVTVNYSTANGSAKVGSDYTSTTGSVTFYMWQTSKTIDVPIINDTIHENSESLYMNISNSDTGYIVTDSQGIGTIYDDDLAPLEARIYNRYEKEKDSNWILKFTVKLNQNAPKNITMNYITQDNTAIEGEDYIASSGKVTIPKGSKYGYIPITIIGDTIPESTERFKIKISSISQGKITRSTATGTIKNDDTIRLYIKSHNTKEGNIGDSNKMPFTLYLKKAYPLDTPLTINYQTLDGSNPTATANIDYKSKSGTVTFNKGDIEKIVYIDIIGDKEIEPHEYIKMKIWGSSYIKRSSTQSKILNDDGSFPKLYANHYDFYITEGNSSSKNLNFTLKLNKSAIKGSYFDYFTQDGSAKVSDNDYKSVNTKRYIFKGGERTVTLPIKIYGDKKIENNEVFYIKFKNNTKLKLGRNRATGHILNDDGSFPKMTVNSSYSINEGDSGTRDLNFTMSLDKPAFKNSSFRYYTKNRSAKSNSDYIAIKPKKYIFNGGETNIIIPVTINGDKDIEPNEEFYLYIDNENNITISNSHNPIGKILNDDGDYPKISFAKSPYYIVEGNSGQKELNITLTLDTPALANTHIDYYTKDNTAQDGSTPTEDNDYIATSGTLDIDENSSTAYITVKINGDTNIEPDDSFYLYINNPQNLIIKSNKTKIIIKNDDIHNGEPFVCDEHMYLSSSIKRGSKITGKMWLHRIDTTKSPFGFEVMDDAGENKLYNALAYSETDNYIYGLYYKELFKISKTGKVISLGDVTRLPNLFNNKQAYAGASYNGYYFVTGFGVAFDKIFKIKLSDSDTNRTVTDINLSTAISIKDFSFSPDGKYLYGIADGGKLTKIDISDGNVTFIGEAHTGYEFDSSFSDKNGRFFANDSKGHGFFEFNLHSGTKRFLSDSQPADFNDGANCINAGLVFTDYGDAPISYGPAWHNIANGIYLGDKIDHDLDSYDTVDADGDDINGVDDDDGVTLSDGSDINGTYFDTNATHTLKVKLSKDAYLKVWIDKDINGHFADSDDLIYNSGTKLSAGEHTISFFLPANLTTDTKTYLRARVSSSPSMNPTGFVTDGEVEDYMIKFGAGVQPLNGLFNIERTNSGSFPINSEARNAWFTQIVGRDFDYSLLFYKGDMSQEQIVDNVTVKVELIDEDTNATLYTKYAYIKNTPPKSRINNITPNDLETLPATKRARFRIYYGVDGNNNIIQAPCTTNPQTCFNALPKIAYVDAKDNFAIRPDYYYMTISDKSNPIRVNTYNNSTPLRVSAGYDYNLSVVAYDNSGLRANGYTISNVKRVLEFLDKSNNFCPIKDDYNSTDNFIDGKNSNSLLEIKEVGNYRLSMIDNIWTQVDSIKGDCDINSSTNSANGNIKVGCNIASPDINLSSYPDHFDINLTMQNLPNSTHNDFIYMSEMNSTYNSVALSYQGDILAKNQDNETTKNFTSGYFAQDVELDLNTTTLSDRGVNQPLRTSDGATVVNFARTIEFNSDGNITRELNPILSNLSIITIPSNQFTNEHNGTANIDIRYNIDKNISKTINPIQITFHSFEANSTNSKSISHGEETPPYIPTGNLNLGDTIRNFYFAKVTPDRVNYPRVYTTISRIIRTPLSVDIFCDVNNSYCSQTGVINNTVLTGTTREQTGWYISTNHNGDIDGNVTNLIDNPTGTVTLTPNPTLLTPLSLPNGHNGMESAKFNNCNNQKVEVTIITDPVLAYQPNKYILNCTDNNASQWTGIGQTGNILEVKPKVHKSGKMDW